MRALGPSHRARAPGSFPHSRRPTSASARGAGLSVADVRQHSDNRTERIAAAWHSLISANHLMKVSGLQPRKAFRKAALRSAGPNYSATAELLRATGDTRPVAESIQRLLDERN